MRRASSWAVLCVLAALAPSAILAGGGASGAFYTSEIVALSTISAESLRSVPNEVSFGNFNTEADFFFNSPGDLDAIGGVRFNRHLGGVRVRGVDPQNVYWGQLSNLASQDVFQAGFLSQTGGGLSWGGSLLYETDGSDGGTDSNGASTTGFDSELDSLRLRFTLGKQVGDWYLGGALAYGDFEEEEEDTFSSGTLFDDELFNVDATTTDLTFAAKWGVSDRLSWLIQAGLSDSSIEEDFENRFDLGGGLNVDTQRLDLGRTGYDLSTRVNWYLHENYEVEVGARFDRHEIDLDNPVLEMFTGPGGTDSLEASSDDTSLDSYGVWFRSLIRPHEKVDVYSTVAWSNAEIDARLAGASFVGGTETGTFDSLDWSETQALDLSFGSRLFLTDKFALSVGASWTRFDSDFKEMNTTDTGTPFTTVVTGGTETTASGYNFGASYVLSPNFRFDAGWFDASSGDKPSSAFQRNFVDSDAFAASVTWSPKRGLIR